MEKKNRCCVATCKGERFDLAHKFPRDINVSSAWLQALNDPELVTKSHKKLCDSYQVCARHFPKKDYKHDQSRSLNKNVVPSLNLIKLDELHLARDSTPRQIDDDNLVDLPEKPFSSDEIVDNESGNVESLMDVVECDEFPFINNPLNIKHDLTNTNNSLELDDEQEVDDQEVTITNYGFSTFLEFNHPGYPKKLSLNTFWLRFHCDCHICYNSQTKRRKITPMHIHSNIQPKVISKYTDGGTLQIEWEDGHESTYSIKCLINSQEPKELSFLEKITFDSKNLKKIPEIVFSKLVTSDENIEKTFRNLVLRGFTTVTQIPVHNSLMAKLTIQRLFPHLSTINFAPFNEDHSDISTNISCANFDCGLKCFFAVSKSEIILVDGLNIAEKLKESDLDSFETLNQTIVPLKVRDNNVYHKKEGPIIEVDAETNEISRIQIDVHAMSLFKTLPQNKVCSFFDSLRQFMVAVKINTNQVLLTLEPGTMIILDNWRVLHKLSANGVLLQCYLDRKDFISRSRQVGLL